MEKVILTVKDLAQQGVFGPGRCSMVDGNTDAAMSPQFASSLYFFVITLKEDSSVKKIPIIVKTQPKGERVRELQNSNAQFFNEVTMYSRILPLLGADQINVCPRFLYGKATEGKHPDHDIVILEDLSRSGFRRLHDQYSGRRHVCRIMEKLGAFHGLSYKAKKTRMSELKFFGASLKPKSFKLDFDAMFVPTMKRGFDEAMKRNPKANILSETMALIEKIGAKNLWSNLSNPVEPFACIVHGDFNKNNLLFKIKNGEIEEMKFVDFQMSIYSDPAMDISFFLYMNTSQKSRNLFWDHFLAAYWSGLTSVEPDPGFTFEEFLRNFAKKALYGYVPCSFFLPMMLKSDNVPMEEYLAWSFERRLQRMLTAAGDVGTNAIADIVQHLLDKGYLQAFLVGYQEITN